MQETLLSLEPGGVRSIPEGAVKCDNRRRTTCGRGARLERIRRSGTKARGANRIRYPSSPSSKHCVQGVASTIGRCSIEAKAISTPPGKYGRKTET